MKIQRFRSKTAQEAMSLARLALGPEAVLLQTRRVHAAGFLRLFACPQVEILAAVDSGSSRSPARGYPAAGARNTPAGGTWGEAGTERVGTATRCGGGGAQRRARPRHRSQAHPPESQSPRRPGVNLLPAHGQRNRAPTPNP